MARETLEYLRSEYGVKLEKERNIDKRNSKRRRDKDKLNEKYNRKKRRSRKEL